MSWLKSAHLILTLNCEQSTQLVSDGLDRELSACERWAVRLHAISCWSCRRFGRQIQFLRKALRHQDFDAARLEADGGLPPEIRERIRNDILKR